jgi:hypothetical protein
MAKDIEKQSRQVAPRYSDPFGTLRSEMDRLFDTFMGGLPTFPRGSRLRPDAKFRRQRN